MEFSDSVQSVYNDDLQYYLALSYYNTFQYQKAIEIFLKLYEKEDSDYRVHSIYYLVNIFLVQKDKNKARQFAAELLETPYYKNYATQILKILK
jgi:tetratricopeptide (TPR) repeat protein